MDSPSPRQTAANFSGGLTVPGFQPSLNTRPSLSDDGNEPTVVVKDDGVLEFRRSQTPSRTFMDSSSTLQLSNKLSPRQMRFVRGIDQLKLQADEFASSACSMDGEDAKDIEYSTTPMHRRGGYHSPQLVCFLRSWQTT